MRRLAAGALAGAMVLGVAGPAAAAVPPGLAKKPPEVGFTCDGMPVEVFGGNGRSFFLADGRMGLLRSFEFTGTFTPLEGESVTETGSKTFGRGPRGGEELTCTATFQEEVPGGTFVGSATVRVVILR